MSDSALHGEVARVAFSKKGYLIFRKGVVGDIYGGTAEDARVVSETLHYRMNVSCTTEGRWEFLGCDDGKLIKHIIPSQVDLMNPFVLQFQEVMKQLEAKGLEKEADEAKRLFLDMVSKKWSELFRH